MSNFCIECNCRINYDEYKYSTNFLGVPLCRPHQSWIKKMEYETTEETIRLYFALKKREVPAQLEKYDGFKHIDIAVPEAKINIEVDGIHHNFNSTQALRDLKRTYHSFLKGYYTLRIPNSLVRNDSFLDETANFIVKILNENYDNINKKNFYDQ